MNIKYLATIAVLAAMAAVVFVPGNVLWQIPIRTILLGGENSLRALQRQMEVLLVVTHLVKTHLDSVWEMY